MEQVGAKHFSQGVKVIPSAVDRAGKTLREEFRNRRMEYWSIGVME